MVGVDVIDVQVRGFEGRLARRWHDMEGNLASRCEGGERLSRHVADKVIFLGLRSRSAPQRSRHCRGRGRTASRVSPLRSRATRMGIFITIDARMPHRFLTRLVLRAASRTGVHGKDSRIKVSSASTITPALTFEACRRLGREEGDDASGTRSSDGRHTIGRSSRKPAHLRSSLGRGKRPLLLLCADAPSAFLVSALNVRRQLLQR